MSKRPILESLEIFIFPDDYPLDSLNSVLSGRVQLVEALLDHENSEVIKWAKEAPVRVEKQINELNSAEKYGGFE